MIISVLCCIKTQNRLGKIANMKKAERLRVVTMIGPQHQVSVIIYINLPPLDSAGFLRDSERRRERKGHFQFELHKLHTTKATLRTGWGHFSTADIFTSAIDPVVDSLAFFWFMIVS